jgi:AraC-like DNA-binding protein/mannose-6-phosphate isomerase-like protein (cupin superfamily)
MHPFKNAHSNPAAVAAGRAAVAEPALGYEFVDFSRQPLNLYATELTYCEPHWHEATELMFVLRGSFEVLTQNRPVSLGKGGMVFVRADDLHTLHARQDGSILLAMQFAPALDKIWGPRSDRDPSAVIDCLRPSESEHGALLGALGELVDYVFHSEPVFGDYGLLRRVFAVLERVKLVASASSRPEEMPSLGAGSDRQVDIAKRAIAYAREHYLEDIRLLDVAESMGISYHHLSHTFKAISGFSFREYLTLLRVNKARELLRDETRNITRISSGSGFSEHKHLDAAFKKYFATTPTQYRKRYMNQLLVNGETASDGVNRLLPPEEIETLLRVFSES